MTRKEICNTLCDVVLNQYTGVTSVQIIDCYNFFVIKGITTCSDVVDLTDTISSFEKEHNLDKINIIDLMFYGTKKDTESSDVPSYLSVSSEVRSS